MKILENNDKLVKLMDHNGVELYHLLTDKFKTNTINIFFQDDLSKENATLNALIPAVLRRGTKKIPDMQEIALTLQELYGATFDCGINKKGERHIMQFYMEFVADKYTGDNVSLFDKASDFLFDIVFDPATENGSFKPEFVEQEKENLKKLIESRVNDKLQYAVEKCFEVMCKDEPFGIYEYGEVSEIDKIKSEGLYSQYEKVLKTYPMTVFVTGKIKEESLERLKNRLSQLERTQIKSLTLSGLHKEVKEVNEYVDMMNVSQGKLSLGFRTNISPDNPKYNSLVVFNGILGGGIHSKLFQNVRERASLAYYAFSRLEKFKGLMLISSGIEIGNKKKAYDIIIKQIEDTKLNKISDYEYESTLKAIETGIKSLTDSQIHMVDFYLSQIITGTNDDFDSIIEKMKKVTKQDVVEVAKLIRLDTIYFLTSNGEEQAENVGET